MWGAQFVSNVGSWMQTVAAQWLMLTLTSSATYVARDQAGPGPARPAQGHDRPGPPGNRHALADTPAREAPAQEAPARKTLARKTSARKTPARKTPARKTPAAKPQPGKT